MSKEHFAGYSNEALSELIRGAMREGCIRPCHVYDAVDILLDRLASKPLRNCDVGTAEEQMKRQHDTMCNTTKACPDSDWSCRKCFAEWAQMPYEGGEQKCN